MNFDLEKFSYRLTVLLDEHNMSQTQLAKKVGTTNVTICRYINGERIPRIDVASKIASVFNVSLDYLLGISENVDTENLTKNQDVDIAILMKSLYSLDGNTHLSKKQIEMIKTLLLANKDFILSA
jgi:transcriptional regulator with XRE-family HTH domain